jgi:predicted permease
MSNLWRDIRFALRSFAKQRGFTAAVAISIALGIAANTTVFTMVNALLFGDLPVRAPDRLVTFSDGRTISWPDYVDYRDQTHDVFEGVSAHFPLVPASVGGSREPERVWGQLVDAGFWTVVGAPLQLGRGFSADEDSASGKSPVVVLADGLWRRRFAADPAIVGREIVLNGAKYTVVGVAAPGFNGIDRGFVGDFWAPLSMAEQLMPDLHVADLKTQRRAQWLMFAARLRPGVTRQQAAAAANTIRGRIDREFRTDDHPRPPVQLRKAGGLPGGMQTGVTGAAAFLMVVVGLVLLIACVNVASLLLSRATARQKEIGIRLAIGAGRGRLIRQLLTESVLLSLFGAVIGFLIAAAATRAIAGFQLPLPVPVGFAFHIDPRVVAFTATLAIATGICFGLAPALRATRPGLISALKNETPALASMRRFGVRNMLVLVQVALSLVLLVGAGLFARSLQNAASIDLGMRTDGVLMLAFDPKLNHYAPERTRQFLSQVRDRVSTLPGVTAVSFVDSIPLSLGGTNFGMKTPGAKNSVTVDIYHAGSGYFSVLGIPMLRGRDFDIHKDNGGTVILNEEAARRLFAGRDPLGQQVDTEAGPGEKNRLLEVVGIVRNSKSRTLGEEKTPAAYLFLEAKPDQAMSFFGISVLVRSAAAPAGLASAVRNQIHALDADLPVFNIETMNEHVNRSLLFPRLGAMLLGIFGIAGAVLATVGLYGVMSFAARSRTREIGIRMALGAEPSTVLRMMMADGLLLTIIGLAVGVSISFAATRFAASLLYGISATDPMTFVAIPVLMLAVAAAAVLIPARRAARVTPLQALRCD